MAAKVKAKFGLIQGSVLGTQPSRGLREKVEEFRTPTSPDLDGAGDLVNRTFCGPPELEKRGLEQGCDEEPTSDFAWEVPTIHSAVDVPT